MEYINKFLNQGWPPGRIAKMIGVTTDTILKWRKGLRKMPDSTNRLLMILWKHPEIRHELIF